MMTQPNNVNERLTALERQNARLKGAMLATWAAAVCLVLMGQSKETTFEAVQARKFTLVAQDGKMLAALEPTDEGARLRIREPKGESSVELSTWKDASQLLMRTRGQQAQTHDFLVFTKYATVGVWMAGTSVDGEHKGSLAFSADEYSAKIRANQKPSNHIAFLDLDEGVGRLTLGTERGARFSASSSQSGGSGFYLTDAGGKERLSTSCTEETGPELALYSAEGKKVAGLSGR
jgi:hypothetical protein